jgi:hypothetical protein
VGDERRPGCGCIQGVGAFLIVGIALTVVVSLLDLGEIGAWIIVGGAILSGLAFFLQPEDM